MIEYLRRIDDILKEDAIRQLPPTLRKVVTGTPGIADYLSYKIVKIEGYAFKAANIAYDVERLPADKKAEIDESLAKLKDWRA